MKPKNRTGNTGKKGGQIGNKNAEKWTEEKLIALGEELLEWFKEPENLYFKEFLMEHDLYDTMIANYSEKFISFSKLIKKAQQIQELKIWKFAMRGKLNPAMTIFFFKNKYGMADKVDLTTSKLKEAEKFKFGW